VGVSNIFGFAAVHRIILKHSYKNAESYMHRIASEDKIIVHQNHVNMDYFECHVKLPYTNHQSNSPTPTTNQIPLHQPQIKFLYTNHQSNSLTPTTNQIPLHQPQIKFPYTNHQSNSLTPTTNQIPLHQPPIIFHPLQLVA
jgi:hypothetical protein